MQIGHISQFMVAYAKFYLYTYVFFKISESDVMNLISVDIQNLQKAIRFIHFPWSCPLQICISLYFLYDVLKNAVVPGKITYNPTQKFKHSTK